MLLFLKNIFSTRLFHDIFRYDSPKKCPTILYAVNLWLKSISATGAIHGIGEREVIQCSYQVTPGQKLMTRKNPYLVNCSPCINTKSRRTQYSIVTAIQLVLVSSVHGIVWSYSAVWQ